MVEPFRDSQCARRLKYVAWQEAAGTVTSIEKFPDTAYSGILPKKLYNTNNVPLVPQSYYFNEMVGGLEWGLTRKAVAP